MRTLGIDPGSSVGLALLDERYELMWAKTYLWRKKRAELERALRVLARQAPTRVYVEDPTGRTYPRNVNQAKMLKIAQNIGQVLERARELERICRDLGFAEVQVVPPVKGGTKRGLPRHAWDAYFPTWRGRRISNHARDAAVSAYHYGRRDDLKARYRPQ